MVSLVAVTPYDVDLMRVPSRPSLLALSMLTLLLFAGCRALPPLMAPAASPADEPPAYPDVIGVELRPIGERVYDVAVTISSPYDTPQRYADGWRVLDPDGNVLGQHTLLHDHAAEQPFTRTQRGLHIPEGVSRVTVEGRDLANGFGGATITVDVPA
jgi:hypothetical protein